MRELHVIGFTSDHGGLILAAKGAAETGGFLLRIDDDLVAHVTRARQHGGGASPGAGSPVAAEVVAGQPVAEAAPAARPSGRSALSPREIQARLRAGRTVQEVAIEAGVGTDWIDRFAAPVLAEHAAVVARARQATLHTPRRGPSDRRLEGPVPRNLADSVVIRSAEEFDAGWSAFHLVDSDWLVRFNFLARGRPQVAEWTYDVSTGLLTSRNRLATEVGFADPARRAGAPPSLFDPDEPDHPEAPDHADAPGDTDGAPAARPARTARAAKPTKAGAKPAPAGRAKKVAANSRATPPGSTVVRRAVPHPAAAGPAAAGPGGEGTGAAGAPAGERPGRAV